MILPNDPILPDHAYYNEKGCLKIDVHARAKDNTREIVMSVIPRIKVPDGYGTYIWASGGTYSELWTADEQSGTSFNAFYEMDEIKKISIGFRVDFAKIGQWEIDID